MESKKKYIDYHTALQKMQAFCAYQERCHSEVKTKLIALGIYGDAIDEIIIELIQDNFLNEERFAKAFAHGKSNIKNWGKIRIKQELKLRKISEYCIRKALEEISDEDYRARLKGLIIKKNKLLTETNDFQRNQKIFHYALQKGYESELISATLQEIFK